MIALRVMGYQIKRVDKNQPQVVKAVRATGASVAHTHSIGKGFPDIVIGAKGLTLVGDFDIKAVRKLLSKVAGLKILEGANILVEIKDDSQPPSKRILTEDEIKWHETWEGQISIINNEEEAVELLS